MRKIIFLLDFPLKVGVVLLCGLFFRLNKIIARSVANNKNVIVVAPPGGGNIGDEALVQITLAKFSDFNVDVCVNSQSAFQSETLNGAQIQEVPKLVYGNALGLFRAVFRLRKQFSRASHLVVIGADIIDGAYNEQASFTRIWLAIFGRILGCDVRILGFSLNAKPKKTCGYSLLLAEKIGVNLFLRDPVSHARGVGLGLINAKVCADVVFCDDRKEVFPLPANIGSQPFVILNVSGLIFKEEHSINSLVDVVDHIVSAGLKIILLPHVSRAGADDVTVCDKLFELIAQHHESVGYIRQLLSPRQVRYLCEKSTFVLSGRMHLGVMALSQKKCAFIFSSQGKVEGLLKMFGFADLEIDCTAPYSNRVMRLIDDVLANKLAVTDEVLSGVAQLAGKNFSAI